MHTQAPRVGVGVIVLRDGLVLLGQRHGAHGPGTWALPGGHLEFGDTVAQCAMREVREETGLELHLLSPAPYSNDVLEPEGLHYVTLFVVGISAQGEPTVREPHRCLGWRWCRWREMPAPLFQPLQSLYRSGFVPQGAV